jgi:hypothetical protein
MRWMLALATSVLFAAAFLMPGTVAADGAWLDGPVANWNTPGMAIPMAPPRDPAIDPRCFDTVVVPSTPAMQALVDAGWFLYGSRTTGLPIEIESAQSGADGMCRPTGYQVFLFVDGKLAGTFSPALMNSRDDGSLVETAMLPDDVFQAGYNRYTERDALCCPSGHSTATFKLDRSGSAPVLLLQSVKTEPNSVAPAPGPSPSPSVVPTVPTPRASPVTAPAQAPAQIPR